MRFYKFFKAQFMTLTAILIVGILISLYLNFNRIIFVNPSYYLPEYALLIKNIKEKFLEIAEISKDCEEFKYNVEEFAKALEKLRDFGYYISINVRVSPCQFPFTSYEFPTSSEVEILFSDGKVLYKEVFVFGWKPRQ